MKYNYNGWFDVEADSRDEAEAEVKKAFLGAIDSVKGIDEVKTLKGAWKIYNFHGWFEVNARSPTEALKRAKLKIHKENGLLVGEDEVNTTAPLENMEIDTSYVTEEEQSGLLSHFVMSNQEKSEQHETHAASAADAWEALRDKFLYDEHVILFQHVSIPVAISPKWRAMDVVRNQKTPDRLGHQVVVALGTAGEKWWGKNKQVLRVSRNELISTSLMGALS